MRKRLHELIPLIATLVCMFMLGGVGAYATSSALRSHAYWYSMAGDTWANISAITNPSYDTKVYCTDCHATNPCTSGGTGAEAVSLLPSGAWNCVGPSGGSSLTVDNTTMGLSGTTLQVKGALNILPTPTADIPMNNKGFSAMRDAAATHDPLAFNQSGAQLHDLKPDTSTSVQQILGALLGAQFSINDEYNPSTPFFGADATGTTDSSIAITKALAAATANATSNTYAASTKLSGGTYKLNEPILISSAWIPSLTSHAAPIRLVGASEYGTQLTTGMTAGPLIVAESGWAMASTNNGNPIKQTALVTGSTGSAQWASNGSGEWSLDLEELTGVAPMNGSSAFDTRGFYNPSVTSPSNPEVLSFSGGGVDYWANSRDSTLDGQIGAYAAYRGTDNKLHCQVNVSTSGQIKAVSSNTFTVSGVNEWECPYNGSNLFAILKGTASAGTAGTGTIVQRKDETTLLGGATEVFHFGGWHYWPAGTIDSFELAKVARNVASYTQHTAAYTGDSNSEVLFDGFGTNLTMPSSLVPSGTWQWAFEPTYLNGTHITATSGQTGQAWVEAKTTGIGCCGSQIEIGNLDLIGGSVGLASQVASIKGHDIAIENSSYLGIETTGSSYNSSFENIDEGQGELGNAPVLSPIVIGGGISSVDNLHESSAGYMGPYLGGASLTNSYVAPGGGSIWGIICGGSCYLDNDNEDSENGGTFYGLTLVTDPTQATRQFTIVHSIIEQQGSGIAPVREECSNAIDSKFINNVFNVQNNSLTTEVDSTACGNTFGNPVDFDNNKLNGGGNVDASPPTGVTFVNNNQPFSVEGTISIPPVYSAATHAVPTPFTNSANAKACVSDSTACTAGTTYTSGGSTVCELSWNGSAWKETGVGFCM